MRRALQTIPEMTDQLIQEINNGSGKKRMIYKTEAEEFKKGELANDISRAINAIAEDRERVDFSNIADVKQRITDYFSACAAAGVYPSVQGLASYGFGISRQALNQWRNRNNNRGSEVSLLIDRACDMMADILTNQSLHNNANPVQSLFQLKNNHSFADRVEIEPVTDNSFERSPEVTIEYLQQKYGIAEEHELPSERAKRLLNEGKASD